MPHFILNELSTLEAGLTQLTERIQHYQRALEKLQQAFTKANVALEYAQNERDRLNLECEALRSERHLLATRIENAKHALQTTLGDLSHTGWVEPALHLLPVPDDENSTPSTTLVLSDSPETPTEQVFNSSHSTDNQAENVSSELATTNQFTDISSDISDVSDISDAPNVQEKTA